LAATEKLKGVGKPVLSRGVHAKARRLTNACRMQLPDSLKAAYATKIDQNVFPTAVLILTG
jgi:hypothetical protein